jgi:ribosomal protein S18 acetylase RimI-like enzyme
MPFVLEPIWTGRRVSIRRAANRSPDGRQLYSDVVGDLVNLTDQTALIASHGRLIVVPLAEVAIARLVPASTAEELALEEISAKGWRAAETERLGGWLLRANGGFTKRANSVHAVRQPSLPLDDALDYARAWYAARDLPLRINLPTEGRRLLDAYLGERGFEPSPDNHIMVARLEQLHGDAGATTLTTEPGDEWFGNYRDGLGAEPGNRALLLRHETVAFAGIRRAGELVAIGRGTVDDGWLGITAVAVAATHRRTGLATAIMAGLWDWGRELGAQRSYLEVESHNTSAVGLYTGLGYWVHHNYRTRTEVAEPDRGEC